MLPVHLFVYFARVCFCPFSLPLGVEVGCGLDSSISRTFLLTFLSGHIKGKHDLIFRLQNI